MFHTQKANHSPIQHVLHFMAEWKITIPHLIQIILQSHSDGPDLLRDNLISHAPEVAKLLYEHAVDSMFTWVFDIVLQRLRTEVYEIARETNGFHTNANSTSIESVADALFIDKSAKIMQNISPCTWKLIQVLLNASNDPRRKFANENSVGSSLVSERVHEALGERLGSEGGDVIMLDGTASEQLGDRKGIGIASSAAVRHTRLRTIKSVMAMSILIHSTNQKANYIQNMMGFFFHSASVPEKVIETLAHAGLSVSLSTIHAAISSLSRDASKKLRESTKQLTSGFAYDNFDITFRVHEPTVSQSSSFVSATSATSIPIYFPKHLNKEVLRCSNYLWTRDNNHPSPTNPVNIDPRHIKAMLRSHLDSIPPTPTTPLPPKSNIKLSPLLERLAWHVRRILVDHGPGFSKYKDKLGKPDPIQQIPPHKSKQQPFRAMNIKESTPEGNMEVMNNLLRQAGLGEPCDPKFRTGEDVDISEWVLLVHGDLLTKERLESVKASRRIETTPKRRFQFVVFLPGLFHFEMACVDAIWRTWIQPVEGRQDPNSLFQHIRVLRKDETGKFTTKPGFQRMHHVIHHDLWTSMLDCWQLETLRQHSCTLKEFGERDHIWDLIVFISRTIVQEYVGWTEGMDEMREKPIEERDQQFENQLLRNRDELLYLELYHAINHGDVGRVEAVLLNWIYIFRACGKHKYTHHMLKFMFDLQHLYPPQLVELIRMNWMCNPTGKEDGFRGVDWVVERNNLYTKVIYGGSGSNYSIQRVIEESNLIEIFRHCHVSIENAFHLEHRTIKHSSPDMTSTIHRLQYEFTIGQPHVFKKGRSSTHVVPDQIERGINTIQKMKFILDDVDEHEKPDLAGEDLGVE